MSGPKKLLRFLRRNRLTQEAFAKLAGIPGPQVSLYLKPEGRRPGVDNAFKIEEATGGAVRASDWRRPARRLAAGA